MLSTLHGLTLVVKTQPQSNNFNPNRIKLLKKKDQKKKTLSHTNKNSTSVENFQQWSRTSSTLVKKLRLEVGPKISTIIIIRSDIKKIRSKVGKVITPFILGKLYSLLGPIHFFFYYHLFFFLSFLLQYF